MWYPFESRDNELITGQLTCHGNLCAGVLPHAGLFYSGKLRRAFFERICEDRNKVLIISPSHYYALPAGCIVISDFTASETPFGTVPSFTPEIEKSIINNDVIQAEHGVEMFLPFIGRKGGMSVAYAVISSLEKSEDAKEIATHILPAIDEKTIVIASSDFTHYGPRFHYSPYGKKALEKVEEHDRKAAMLIARNKGIEAYREFASSTICGIAPSAITAEIAALKNWKGETGPHSSSFSEDEGEENFVSYQTVFWSEQ